MDWEIVYYRDDFQKTILTFPPGLTERMLTFGPDLGLPHTRAMGKGLFELRLKTKAGFGRVFFCNRVDAGPGRGADGHQDAGRGPVGGRRWQSATFAVGGHAAQVRPGCGLPPGDSATTSGGAGMRWPALTAKEATTGTTLDIHSPSSLSCLASTAAGAPVMRSRAFWFLGKAMTSRMLAVRASIMAQRSSPRAMPP